MRLWAWVREKGECDRWELRPKRPAGQYWSSYTVCHLNWLLLLLKDSWALCGSGKFLLGPSTSPQSISAYPDTQLFWVQEVRKREGP